MAVMVLVLSVMPCADGASATKGSKTTVVAMKTDNSGGETGDDNCSPFCQCACCAGFSISHPVANLEFAVIHSTLHFSFFSSTNVAGIALPVWQPPKPILS